MRVNIAAVLPAPLDSAVRVMNARLVDTGLADIRFDHRTIPHLTMLMGDVDDVDIPAVVAGVRRVSSSVLHPFRIELGAPRDVPHEDGAFVFSDLIDARAVIDARNLLLTAIDSSIRLHRYGRPENPPHITIGHSRRSLPDGVLDRFEPLGAATISQLQLCVVGDLGTCVRRLELWDLRLEGRTD